MKVFSKIMSGIITQLLRYLQQSRKYFLRLVFVVLIIFSIDGYLVKNAQAEIRYGLWIIEVEPLIESMPINLPKTKIKQCITQQNMVPSLGEEQCLIVNQKLVDNTLQWDLKCGDRKISGAGKIYFNGDRLRGKINFFLSIGEPNVLVDRKILGLRIGDCNTAH